MAFLIVEPFLSPVGDFNFFFNVFCFAFEGLGVLTFVFGGLGVFTFGGLGVFGKNTNFLVFFLVFGVLAFGGLGVLALAFGGLGVLATSVIFFFVFLIGLKMWLILYIMRSIVLKNPYYNIYLNRSLW